MIINNEKIKQSVETQSPIELIVDGLPRSVDEYNLVLTKFLEACNQQKIEDNLVYCLGELLSNADKANLKRLYFKEKGLDINNSDDYKLGMKTFLEETFSNFSYYAKLKDKENLYVKLYLLKEIDKIIIETRNNSILTEFEYERIFKRIDNAKQFNSLAEAVMNVDSSEGAGLGIVSIILILKKIGLDKSAFNVYCNNGETITGITLPLFY